jgi:hypothetical protein
VVKPRPLLSSPVDAAPSTSSRRASWFTGHALGELLNVHGGAYRRFLPPLERPANARAIGCVWLGVTGRFLAALLLEAFLFTTDAWAPCNRITITVDGTVEPPVAGALVRLEAQPSAGNGRDSDAVWPDADGSFSASLWYSTSVKGEVGALFGDDCSRKPREVVVSLVAGDRTLATARLDAARFLVDALGNYRAKSRVTLRGDGR